jgi:fatty acid desaturase
LTCLCRHNAEFNRKNSTYKIYFSYTNAPNHPISVADLAAYPATPNALGGFSLTRTPGVCDIPLASYIFLVAYPGIFLSQLRSFAEHQSHADPRLRTNVIESGWLFSLLFLSNNLHIAQNAKPCMSWYRLRATWPATRVEANRTGVAIRPSCRSLYLIHWLRPIIAGEAPLADGAPS